MDFSSLLAILVSSILLKLTGSNQVIIITSKTFGYKAISDNGVDINYTNKIIFQVKACNDAHVALSQDRGDFTNNTMEIIIGGWTNSKIGFRTIPQTGQLVAEKLGTFVDCNEGRIFWLEWANNTVMLGSGNVTGSNIILDYRPINHPVNYIGVSTGFTASGVWVFDDTVTSSTKMVPILSSSVHSQTHPSLEVNDTSPTSLYMEPDANSVRFLNSEEASLRNVIRSSHISEYALLSSSEEFLQTPSNFVPKSSDYMSYALIMDTSVSLIQQSDFREYVTPFHTSEEFVSGTILIPIHTETLPTHLSNALSYISEKAILSSLGDLLETSSNDVQKSSDMADAQIVDSSVSFLEPSALTENLTSMTNENCICRCLPEKNYTELETGEAVHKIKRKLLINPSTLSFSKRKFISVKDSRPVAVTFGVFGVLILTLAILLIILPDLISLIHYICFYFELK